MKTKRIAMAMLFALSFTSLSGQNPSERSSVSTERKFSVSTTHYSLLNFGQEKTNTHHYELHGGYRLTQNDRIGIKVATWKMFAPMGMPMQEQLRFDEDNFYPGRLLERGIGVTYQRMLWQGLFASVEVLPQIKTYLDENDLEIRKGFKLYRDSSKKHRQLL